MGLTRAIGLGLAVLIAALNLAACATMGDPPPTLYKRLGGREGISIVVADFVTNMKGPEIEKLKSNLSDQICDATGGPCSYLGRDMKTAHKGMQVTEAEWNATVENLVKAMDKHQVGPTEKSELLGALGPMKADIVGQ
jgi:hemoglobin